MPFVNGTTFKLGADPEVFLKDTNTGRYVGALASGCVGTKEVPQFLHRGSSVQVDGMALEFNTNPTAYRDTFMEEVVSCKKTLVNTFLRHRSLRLVIKPTVDFDDEEWARQPLEARILGCNADYSGWTLKSNPSPNRNVKFRTGAGHIHVGWGAGFQISDDLLTVGGALAKEMDATVGVASLLYDGDTRRRELYGRAGAFRPKSYGMEYRVLSNEWVKSRALIGYVYSRTSDAIKNLMHKRPIHCPDVETIINSNDVSGAREWLGYHNIPLPPKQHRCDNVS